MEPFEPPDDFLRGDDQDFLFRSIGFGENLQSQGYDEHLHDTFWQAMYNDELTRGQRQFYYDDLSAYVWNQYGLTFWDLWDWEDFRAWYDANA